jgi:transaldolase
MTRIFADGADLSIIEMMNKNPNVSGFTSNPTLAKKAGVKDYEEFAKEALKIVGQKPFSFEVFADDFENMERQALKISEWGENVFVKIPITNTFKQPSYDLIKKLATHGVKINVTAVLTKEQIKFASRSLENHESIISVFAGRIFDSGMDATFIMRYAMQIASVYGNYQKILWASPRQVYDYVLAKQIGVDIITMTNELINKIPNIGRSLEDISLDTVKMFRDDALSSRFEL